MRQHRDEETPDPFKQRGISSTITKKGEKKRLNSSPRAEPEKKKGRFFNVTGSRGDARPTLSMEGKERERPQPIQREKRVQ